MAIIYPDFDNISRLKVKPTEGELYLANYLVTNLDDSYEIFFNPFLDGDRPDFIVLKEGVGAFVIEVKDYQLANYRITERNRWQVNNGTRWVAIASPQSQAFRYKKNLYELHLPVLGLNNLSNPNFYRVVYPLVYLHCANKSSINQLYMGAEQSINFVKQELSQQLAKKKISYDEYNWQSDKLQRYSKALTRDKSLAYGNDALDSLIRKIKSTNSHVLFDDRIYDDFKRRLLPSEHTKTQGILPKLDDKQHGLTLSKPGHQKVKGVAGCGKTTILANRATNAQERHGNTVLIVTFNITLKNLIKDKVSDILGRRDQYNYGVTNYHQFFISQLIAIGEDIHSLREGASFDEIFKTDYFKDKSVEKFDTILIDEVQDYEPEWVKIVRDNFLAENGEMVLFGDESQNIYQRETQRAAVIAQGFGRWVKLKRSYRTTQDSPLNQLFKDFQEKYLLEKYSDSELTAVMDTQTGFNFDLMVYEPLPDDWIPNAFEKINSFIQQHSLHPNDIVILSSHIFCVRHLAELFKERENVHCMFEDYEELHAQLLLPPTFSIEKLKQLNELELRELITKQQAVSRIESARRAKKNHFYGNSGHIKLSTIHSYKGLESKTVFYILDDGDSPEVAYTSITRTTENLIVLDKSKDNQFSSFFSLEIAESTAI
ncbi:nuclease-related domain-containing DEAD/DEAH box helicase [Paraferrimonas sp. SM1919]|uniref:nuclease-related domain-containing DEAD/DEAH box helicase n=1 Tax=Paraferrimonas sp. SM1919 TaxID=2662263 RepID=UPI0013D1A191|nr:NERD domain-containing protein/DEAD/DEAH box helicase [Paraferrimonas sp. SM1919]